MTHKAQGFTLDDYPNVKRWYAEVRARPQVQAGLAIGKFVKEPFDEEARRNMFGRSEGDGGEKISRQPRRHCEERSDEAIHTFFGGTMDCFASLAMTVGMTLV